MGGDMLGHRILGLVLMLLLAGCDQTAVRNGEDPLAFLAAGSEVQLTRDLEIPAGETRIFFQRGKTITKGELDHYQPSCDLEVWELRTEGAGGIHGSVCGRQADQWPGVCGQSGHDETGWQGSRRSSVSGSWSLCPPLSAG